MSTIPNANSSEPALSVGAVAAAVGAVLTLLVAFGVDLTEAQTEAILGVVLVAGPLVLAAITRSKVYSPSSVVRLLHRR
jgi:purine-cytosine permease-like protein